MVDALPVLLESGMARVSGGAAADRCTKQFLRNMRGDSAMRAAGSAPNRARCDTNDCSASVASDHQDVRVRGDVPGRDRRSRGLNARHARCCDHEA